jgi:hypothetical protein
MVNLLDARDCVLSYREAVNLRSPYEPDWRTAAAHLRPRHYSAWTTPQSSDVYNYATEAARRISYDATGAKALRTYTAVLERIMTPASVRYQKLGTDNPELNRSRAVQEYFDEVTRILFQEREAPRARFRQAQTQLYGQLGMYGTAPKFIARRKRDWRDPTGGLHFRSVFLRNVYVLLDHEGEIYAVFRDMYLNARQVRDKFCNDDYTEDKLPAIVAAELKKATPSETTKYHVVHVVCYASDHDPERLDARRHRVAERYLFMPSQEWIGKRSGYMSMPWVIPTLGAEADETYGFSVANQAYAALGSVSAMKKTLLKQGQKAVEPVLLAHDDGVLNSRLDLRPGAVNYGAIDAQGRKLVDTLPTGNFRVAEGLLQDERKDIDDLFFVTLFQILLEKPEMTATQVMENIAEKAALLAPTMGTLQSNDLGPQTERELAVLAEAGLLPEMPPELQEAGGEYSITYASPLAKSQNMEEVTGFARTVEVAVQAATVTQDPSTLDWINFDEAIPEIAAIQSVRPRWINTPDKVEAKRNGRQAQAEQQQLVDAAPAMANVASTMMKAQQSPRVA